MAIKSLRSKFIIISKQYDISNFFTTSRKCFPSKKKKNTFLKTKPNFSLTGKCFPLINFFNGKQTQESLENDFQETTFCQTTRP